MKISDYNLDNTNNLIKRWKFSSHLSTLRTAIFKRGKYHRAVIGANKKIVLCRKLDAICGKDTALRRKVVDILKNVVDPVERLFALRFAFDQVTLDYNDINLNFFVNYVTPIGEWHRTIASDLQIGNLPEENEVVRSTIDWDIIDIPSSTVSDVDLVAYIEFAYGGGVIRLK